MGMRADLTEAREEARAANDRANAAYSGLELAQESLGKLQLAMEDNGWAKIGQWGDQEFSREGLRTASKLSRVMAVANPLIKRGLNVRNAYIFGGGYQIKGREAKVNEVVQRLMEDEGNQRAVFGEQATEENERALGTDGNVFIAAFANPTTGYVRVRTVGFDEVEDIVTNPQDKDDPWFYLRNYTSSTLNRDGTTTDVLVREYHPAMGFYPAAKPKAIGGIPVVWDVPMLHVKVNALDGWKFGVGDAYAALPWARTYRDFLADWATLVKALSQFAFKLSGGDPSKSDQLRQAIARATQGDTPAGSTAVMDANTHMEAIPKTGATIDSESGKPLAAMVAAAMGIPVTVLLGDPGQTGARAVAETLDKPTVFEMNQRRRVWEQAFRKIIDFAIRNSVTAPASGVSGRLERDPWSGEQITVLRGNKSQHIEVVWASLKDVSTAAAVQAVVNADTTGKVPPLVTLELLLTALEVSNAEDIIDEFREKFDGWEPVLGAPDESTAVGHTDNTFRDGDNEGSDDEATPTERAGDS